MCLASPYWLVAQEDQPVIAVLDFEYSGIPKTEASVFMDFVTSLITQTGKYTVIDKAQRLALLQEMEFSYSDCADEKCQLEVGRLLAANQIVVGSIGKVSNRYFLNMKLVEVETARTVNTASKMYKSMDDLLDDSPNVVAVFVGEDEVVADDEETEVVVEESQTQPEPTKTPSEPSEQQVPTTERERKGGAIEACLTACTYGPVFGGAGAFTYQFNNWFSLGAWLGFLAPPAGVPMGGVKLVFGNKVDSIAVSFNLGFPSSIGLYFRNFYFNGGLFPGVGSFAIALELGYSFYFGK